MLAKKKRFVVLVFLLLVLSLFFVVAEEENGEEEEGEEVDLKELKSQYLGFRDLEKDVKTNLIEQLNALEEDKKLELMRLIVTDLNIESLGGLTIDTFNENGNLQLSGGNEISLHDIKGYNEKVGKKEGFVYDFRGESYKGNLPKIKDIRVEDGKVIYDFEGDVSLKTDSGSYFDFENRRVVVGKKDFGWNMLGGVEVNGDEIDLKIVHGQETSDLKNFPVLEFGEEKVSPYGEVVEGFELDKDYKKPGSGMFNLLEKDGKRYSVDSEGIVRELKNSKISINNDGQIDKAENLMIDVGDNGEFFTQTGTRIMRGDDIPEDKSTSYVWFGEKDDKPFVSINSVGEENMYYNVKSNLAELELNGNVLVKNGGYFLKSDKEGNIQIRKGHDSEEGFEFLIDKLYSLKKKDDYLQIKVYEGDNENFKDKIAVLDKEGNLVFGGFSVDINKGGKSMQKYAYQWAINNVKPRTNDPGVLKHEAVHYINSELTSKLGISSWSPSEEGQRAFYIWDKDEYYVISNTGVKKIDVLDLVPTELTNHHQNYFFNHDFGQRDALHIIEDFSAEISSGEKSRLLSDKIVFSSALGLKMEQLASQGKSNYWSSERGDVYRGSIKEMIEMATPGLENRLQGFKTSNNEKAVHLRDFLRRTYGSAWTQQHLGF